MPDIHLTDSSEELTVGVSAAVPLSGLGLVEGNPAFFVRVTDVDDGATCDSVDACYAEGECPWNGPLGGKVTHGGLPVTLPESGVYSLCYGTRPDALLPSEFALIDLRLQVVKPPPCHSAQSWEAHVEPAPHWLTPALLAEALKHATHVHRIVIESIPHDTEEEVTVEFDVCDDRVFSQSHHVEHAEQAAAGRGVLLHVERPDSASSGHRRALDGACHEPHAECHVGSDGTCGCELRAELRWKSKPEFLEFILAWRQPGKHLVFWTGVAVIVASAIFIAYFLRRVTNVDVDGCRCGSASADMINHVGGGSPLVTIMMLVVLPLFACSANKVAKEMRRARAERSIAYVLAVLGGTLHVLEFWLDVFYVNALWENADPRAVKYAVFSLVLIVVTAAIALTTAFVLLIGTLALNSPETARVHPAIVRQHTGLIATLLLASGMTIDLLHCVQW